MRRTPLKRRVPLDAKAGLKRKHTKAKRNRQALAKAIERKRIKFGLQAELCHDMPCCVCIEHGLVQTSRTQAHHEPPRSRGGIDVDCLPLCGEHHRRRHDRGHITFWREVGIDPVVVVAHMRKLTNERIARGEAA